jgi:DNA-binding transcriptional LysR family regulator
MHFRGLDLNLLVALNVLIEEASVTEAGRRLHLSQSAMSGVLTRLRNYFEDPLLVQVGRGMQPTPCGLRLSASVRAILAEIDLSVIRRPDFDPAMTQRRIRIAASDYAIDVLLLDVQRRCAELAPGFAFDILPINEAALKGLRRAEIDLVILPDTYRQPACPSVMLFTDRLACVTGHNNPIVGTSITLRAFKAAEHVLFQPDPGQLSAFDRWLQQTYRFEPVVKLVLPSYASLPLAVVDTPRITTIPERLARLFAARLPIRILTPTFRLPTLNEIMQWHAAHETDSGLAWLRNLIVETAATLDTNGSQSA